MELKPMEISVLAIPVSLSSIIRIVVILNFWKKVIFKRSTYIK